MALDIVLPAPRRRNEAPSAKQMHVWRIPPGQPVLGLIDNAKTGADRMLRAIGNELVNRKVIASYFFFKKESSSHSMGHEHRSEMLARAHVIISGVGD